MKETMPSDMGNISKAIENDDVILSSGYIMPRIEYNKAKQIYNDNEDIQKILDEQCGIDMISRLFEADRGEYIYMLNSLIGLAKILREFSYSKPNNKSRYFDNISFVTRASEEYMRVSEEDKKGIDKLINNIWDNGLGLGIGKPERISFKKGYKGSFWCRKITEKDRLCYKKDIDEKGCKILVILSCNQHYSDK